MYSTQYFSQNFFDVFLRFTDEVHFKGGALVGSQMLSWAAVMFAWNARAPNPEQFGKLAFLKKNLGWFYANSNWEASITRKTYTLFS